MIPCDFCTYYVECRCAKGKIPNQNTYKCRSYHPRKVSECVLNASTESGDAVYVTLEKECFACKGSGFNYINGRKCRTCKGFGTLLNENAYKLIHLLYNRGKFGIIETAWDDDDF